MVVPPRSHATQTRQTGEDVLKYSERTESGTVDTTEYKSDEEPHDKGGHRKGHGSREELDVRQPRGNRRDLHSEVGKQADEQGEDYHRHRNA